MNFELIKDISLLVNSIGAGNCFLLAAAYIPKGNTNTSQTASMLSVLFFLVGMVILNTVLNFTQYSFLIYGFEPLTNALTFAIAPVLFLYVRSLTSQNSKVRLISKHLILFYAFFLITVISMLFPENLLGRISGKIVNNGIIIPIWNLHFLCYLIISFLHLKKIDTVKNRQPKFIFWMITFIWGINLVLYLFRMLVQGLPNLLYLNITLLFTAAMLWFSYQKLVFHNENARLRHHSKKYGKMQSDRRDMDSIINAIKEHRYYQNPDLTIRTLSHQLDVPYHELSILINSKCQKNFNEFINGFRIQEVEKALKSGEHNSLTIMGIAQRAGFKSSSVFYAAFKKEKGTTPKSYISRNSHSI